MAAPLKKIEVDRLSAAIAARLKISLHSALSTLRRNLDTLARQQPLSPREQLLLSRIIRLEILLKEIKADSLTQLPKTAVVQQVHELKELLKAARKNAAPEMARSIDQAEKAAGQFEAITKVPPQAAGSEIKSITFDHNMVRLQIEMKTTDKESAPESFRVEIAVPREKFEQNLPLDEIIMTIDPENIEIKSNSEAAGIFGRTIARDISEQLTREIIKEVKVSGHGQLTVETVERAAEKVGQKMPEAAILVEKEIKPTPMPLSVVPTKGHGGERETVNGERETVIRDRERIPAEQKSRFPERETKPLTIKVVIEHKAVRENDRPLKVESIKIRVEGEAREADLINLMRAKPAETVRNLLGSAARMIADNPTREPEIARIVTVAITKTFENQPQPAAIKDNPAPAPTLAVAVVQSDNNGTAETFKGLMAVYEAAVESGNLPLKEVVEKVIAHLADTDVGRQFVAVALIHDQVTTEPIFTSPALAEKVTCQVAAAIVEMKTVKTVIDQKPVVIELDTPVEPKVIQAVLNGRDNSAKFALIGKLIAGQNGLVSPANLKPAEATKLLELTAKTKAVLDLAENARKTAPRKNNQKTTPTVVSFGSARAAGRATGWTSPAATKLLPGQVKEVAKAVKELSRTADRLEFKLPDSLEAGIRAALSGARLIPQQAVTPGNFTTEVKPTSNRLNYFVQALESQLANVQAVSRAAARSAEKLAALSTQVLLYGTLMRLVSGEVGTIDALIKELKKMAGFDEIIEELEKDPDLVVETLNKPVLVRRLKKFQTAA